MTWLRRGLRALLAAVVLIVVAALAGWPVYVRPQVDQPRHADAIVVLGGPAYLRYPKGFELSVQGWAPAVLVSNPNGARDPWLTQYCANPDHPFELHCVVPDPPNTREEGRLVRDMAAKYGWHTLIVVTFTPHVSRARYMLERCFDGQLVMVASPADLSLTDWIYQYAYQTAGYVRAVLNPGC